MLDTVWTWFTAASPLAVLFAFALAFLAALLGLQQIKPDTVHSTPVDRLANLRSKLGVAGVPIPIFLAAATIWTAILLMLLYGFAAILYEVVFATPPETDAGTWDFRFLLAQFVAVTTVLGAVVAFPVTLNRLRLTAEDNETKLQGQITERINNAVENLGATRSVKRQRKRKSGTLAYERDAHGEPDFSKPIFEEVTEPNLEVRFGAIYALERIASDDHRYHLQVMEILTAYVRENARAADAKRSPHEIFDELTRNTEDKPGLHPEDAFQNSRYQSANMYGWSPEELSPENLERWAREQLSPREDIRLAMQIIGRRTQSQIALERREGYQIDLARSNLQGITLSGNFAFASFADSRLDGVTLDGSFREAQFGLYADRALSAASMQAATCRMIDATGSDFSGANLDAAFFGGARLDNCKFRLAKMDHTNFNGAQVKKADFAYADCKNVYCYDGAYFDLSRFYRTNLGEFKGLTEGPTERLWVAGNVKMTPEQEERFGRMGKPVGNEMTNRREWRKWQEDPVSYVLPQHRDKPKS